MQHGIRFDMCPFGTGAFQVGSKQRAKPLKINGLGYYREAFSGEPVWTIQTAKAFPCSVALAFFSVGVLPCSMALVLKFVIFLLVPHVGLSEGVRNVVKPMLFCLFSE